MFRNPSAKSVRASLASFSIATSYSNLGDVFFAFIGFEKKKKKTSNLERAVYINVRVTDYE